MLFDSLRVCTWVCVCVCVREREIWTRKRPCKVVLLWWNLEWKVVSVPSPWCYLSWEVLWALRINTYVLPLLKGKSLLKVFDDGKLLSDLLSPNSKSLSTCNGEGNGTPLQYSCLGKSRGQRSLVGCSPRGHECRTWLSNFTFTFHFHALEKEMATHSSVLAWRIPRKVEPGGLPSMGSHRVRHDWSDLAAIAACMFLWMLRIYVRDQHWLCQCTLC